MISLAPVDALGNITLVNLELSILSLFISSAPVDALGNITLVNLELSIFSLAPVDALGNITLSVNLELSNAFIGSS